MTDFPLGWTERAVFALEEIAETLKARPKPPPVILVCLPIGDMDMESAEIFQRQLTDAIKQVYSP